MVISHCQAFSARPSSGARAAAAAASQAGFHWVNGIHAERPGPGQAESATSLFSTFEADPKAGTCRTCRRPQCSCCGTLIFISIPPVAFEAVPRMHDQADRSALSGKYYGCGPWMWWRIQWDSQSQVALCFISLHHTTRCITLLNATDVLCKFVARFSDCTALRLPTSSCTAGALLTIGCTGFQLFQGDECKLHKKNVHMRCHIVLHLSSVHDPTFQLCAFGVWGTFPETQGSD